MGKGLHKLFKAVVNELQNAFPTLGESESEVSHFIVGSSNFSEVTSLPAYVKKAWLKLTLKEIKNLIKNHTFLMYDPDKLEIVTPCMDVYKANIQSDGSLENLKLRILVRGEFQNK